VSPAAAYSFLPWVRYGVLNRLLKADPFDATAPLRADLPIKVRVGAARDDGRTTVEDVSVALALYGPGDVTGIDPRAVVRTSPPNLAADFPPHLFAAIEFDRPDFPWLFTPAAADDQRLRPWIVLVVVRKALVELEPAGAGPLPVLHCPATELPDPTEAWLWAHAQFAGDPGTQSLQNALHQSNQSISRLVCPRRLDPDDGSADGGYLACVVPAFEVGRLAGLGRAVASSGSLSPAWSLGDHALIDLPVYYSWEFRTGAAGDFEDLVDQLSVLGVVPGTEPHLMDIGAPSGGLGPFPGATLGVPGALRPFGAAAPAPPSATPSNWFALFQQQLRGVLTAPPTPTSGVRPPVYGFWQAPVSGTQDPLAGPGWLSELNLDPRQRLAAGLGARVIERQQEQLVAAAWDQAGELAEANDFLRQKQLGREVTRSIFDKRLKMLSAGSLQQITAPVAIPAPAAASPTPTLLAASPTATAQTDPLVEATVSGAFRRLARPRGPAVDRRVGASRMQASLQVNELVARAARAELRDVQVSPPQPSSAIAAGAAGVAFQSAPPAPARTLLGTDPTSTLLQQLDPTVTFTQEAQARLDLPPDLVGAWSRPEPLAPLQMTPSFPQPMYEPLRDLFRDLLLQGLDQVPNNSLMLLQVDPKFVESYLVGLNDAFSRELLWREFPTDLHGTYFRQFWDVRDQLTSAPTESDRERLRDVGPISMWQQPLGSNLRAGRGSNLILLLIKGDLLTRFPTALIYAAPARWSTDSSGRPIGPPVVDESQPPRLPSLRVDPVLGVTLLGFDIPNGRVGAVGDILPSAGGGNPGWFFILEEHPTEPRFGLDISTGRLDTWRELSWADIALRDDGSKYIAARSKTPSLLPLPPNSPPTAIQRWNLESQMAWGHNAAEMAYITLQKAFRMEVHARTWFGAA
jgi:hypothetical protein